MSLRTRSEAMVRLLSRSSPGRRSGNSTTMVPVLVPRSRIPVFSCNSSPASSSSDATLSLTRSASRKIAGLCSAAGSLDVRSICLTAFLDVSFGSLFVGSSNHCTPAASHVATSLSFSKPRNGRQMRTPPSSVSSCGRFTRDLGCHCSDSPIPTKSSAMSPSSSSGSRLYFFRVSCSSEAPAELAGVASGRLVAQRGVLPSHHVYEAALVDAVHVIALGYVVKAAHAPEAPRGVTSQHPHQHGLVQIVRVVTHEQIRHAQGGAGGTQSPIAEPAGRRFHAGYGVRVDAAPIEFQAAGPDVVQLVELCNDGMGLGGAVLAQLVVDDEGVSAAARVVAEDKVGVARAKEGEEEGEGHGVDSARGREA
ncbi:hypothetical protein VUR80DRAFT_721 [Thermomyces stellatus]